MGQQLFILL